MSKESEPRGEIALLALGSNLGDRRATLDSAVAALRRTNGIEVVAVSAFIDTDPVGVTDQPRFLNGAVKISTTLTPRQLLAQCLAIEQTHGRTREGDNRWGPRTLDIDLLLYGERIIDQPGLRIPHPRLHERLFALQPAAEIAGGMRHPLMHKTISQLLA